MARAEKHLFCQNLDNCDWRKPSQGAEKRHVACLTVLEETKIEQAEEQTLTPLD
jgi:hypothetical protein